MNVKDAINQRKSIRKYLNKQVPEDIIKDLLDAARKAPSAKNTQSHKYFIVKNQDVINELKKEKAFEQPFVYDAPLIIVCCADSKQYPERKNADSSPEDYALIDLSIAASFLVLRATELGLGSVFVAWIYADKVRKILGIPEEYIIPFVLPIGYPAEDPDPRSRKDLDEILF
ncbi:MAG: nitroreductase family protein [Nanoarchaeota archaeon]|nr:nitroreductase family protein [Nanoarchaeota archaeon]MBU1135645.1 nitroreductase family protein [Nanoarchaeota archaeon]MBU2520010.1 nitroreductase family protein [Nanoarchaeota archaeon]